MLCSLHIYSLIKMCVCFLYKNWLGKQNLTFSDFGEKNSFSFTPQLFSVTNGLSQQFRGYMYNCIYIIYVYI